PVNSDRVFVDVTAYNSKNYYVEGEVSATGRFPITGKERVIDAISAAGGLTRHADREQVVLYRERGRGEPVEALEVNVEQVMLGDDVSTNYQILPGDRLVVRSRQDAGAARAESAETPSARPAVASSKRRDDTVRNFFPSEPALNRSTVGARAAGLRR